VKLAARAMMQAAVARRVKLFCCVVCLVMLSPGLL
jgi:hypothetical protein